MGTYLRVLSEGFPMNTNMTEFRWFKKNLCVILDESSISIEKVKRLQAIYLHSWCAAAK